MRSAGIVLILCGAFVLYQVLHGRLASVSESSPQSSGGGGGGGGGGSGGGGSSNADSGSHMGLSADGTVYTIGSTYGNMTDSQKDDANNYAHTIGNVSG